MWNYKFPYVSHVIWPSARRGIEERLCRVSEDAAGIAHLGQQGHGDIQGLENIGVPFTPMDIIKQGAGGIRDIRTMQGAATELIQQPRIHRSKGQLSRLGPL